MSVEHRYSEKFRHANSKVQPSQDTDADARCRNAVHRHMQPLLARQQGNRSQRDGDLLDRGRQRPALMHVHGRIRALVPVQRYCLELFGILAEHVLFVLVALTSALYLAASTPGKAIASSAKFCLFDLAW